MGHASSGNASGDQADLLTSSLVSHYNYSMYESTRVDIIHNQILVN